MTRYHQQFTWLNILSEVFYAKFPYFGSFLSICGFLLWVIVPFVNVSKRSKSMFCGKFVKHFTNFMIHLLVIIYDSEGLYSTVLLSYFAILGFWSILFTWQFNLFVMFYSHDRKLFLNYQIETHLNPYFPADFDNMQLLALITACIS